MKIFFFFMNNILLMFQSGISRRKSFSFFGLLNLFHKRIHNIREDTRPFTWALAFCHSHLTTIKNDSTDLDFFSVFKSCMVVWYCRHHQSLPFCRISWKAHHIRVKFTFVFVICTFFNHGIYVLLYYMLFKSDFRKRI